MRPPAVLAIGWMAGGLCWTLATFWPWASAGLLSRSSLLDASRFVRQGTLGEIVPPSAAFLLLVPALAGLVLLALAGLGGRPVSAARVVIGLIGVAAVGILLDRLTGWSVGRAGPGAFIALVGVLAVAASMTGQWIFARSARARTADQ